LTEEPLSGGNRSKQSPHQREWIEQVPGHKLGYGTCIGEIDEA
jgi:hypothetical protein